MTSNQETVQLPEEYDYEELSEKCITACAKMISSIYNGSRSKIVEALADVDIASARMSCLMRCDEEKSEVIRAKLAGEPGNALPRG